MPNKKRKRLTLAQKIEIVKFAEAEHIGIRGIAKKFEIGKTQVSEILRNKEHLSKTLVEQGNVNSKRKFPKTDGEIINKMILQWYLHARANNLLISGTLLKEKALEVASVVGLNDFKASNGWLQKFRERHQISYKNVQRESATVKPFVVNDWLSKVKELIKGYEESDIFNCDETGLYFRALPENTDDLMNESCSQGMLSKERLTVMLCGNINGEFQKPLIIGNCSFFNNINTNDLGIIWKFNSKAWMTRNIMTEWLLDLDRRMTSAKRNIVLFLDDSISHPLLNHLKSVKLIFFPRSMECNCQPWKQGVIQHFKMLYRQHLLRHLLLLDTASDLKQKTTALDAIFWIKFAIREIKKSTVRNCFVKSGILMSAELQPIVDDFVVNDFKALVVRLGGNNSVNYAEIDKNLVTENQSLDIKEIMQELIDPETIDDDEDSSDKLVEETTSYILNEELALKKLENLKTYYAQKRNATGLCYISELIQSMEKEKVKHLLN